MSLALPVFPAFGSSTGASLRIPAHPKSKARTESTVLSPRSPTDVICRIHRFETRRGGESRAVPPRTVGIAGLTLSGSPLPDAAHAADAIARAHKVPYSTEAAKEKVGYSRLDGTTAIYQADRQTHSASLCACGNATGATAALLARFWGRPDICLQLRLPNGNVTVRGEVTHADNGAWQVHQSWEGIELAVTETERLGRRAVVCQGGLNDYLIVDLANREQFEAFDVADAVAWWDSARGPWGFADPLRSRLAVLSLGSPRPFVKFYTCGRMHPGAPLTGLAALAIAAKRVPWLAELLSDGEIEHRRGTDLLPQVRTTAKGMAITLPIVDVVFDGM